jgi:ATP-dependent Clp protease protease subunit
MRPVFEKPDNVLIENGLLWLTDDVSEETIPPLVRAIWEINLMPPELQPPIIRLFVNSYGGSMTDGIALLDAMKMSKIPVATIVSGMAGSMGQIIAMHGCKGLRCMTPNSVIMAHQFAAGIGTAKEHELKAVFTHFQNAGSLAIRWFKECTGKSEHYIRKHLQGPSDVFMTPEDALKHGLIDIILKEI